MQAYTGNEKSNKEESFFGGLNPAIMRSVFLLALVLHKIG